MTTKVGTISSSIRLKAALLLGVASLLAGGTSARASFINTSSTLCHAFFPSQAGDIEFLTNGIRNAATANRVVVCGVIRDQVPATARFVSFFFDGANFTNAAATTFTISSFAPNGTFIGSGSITANESTFGVGISFPLAQMPASAYITVLANLPASRQGMITGMNTFAS